jgi:hypothetical protein
MLFIFKTGVFHYGSHIKSRTENTIGVVEIAFFASLPLKRIDFKMSADSRVFGWLAEYLAECVWPCPNV